MRNLYRGSAQIGAACLVVFLLLTGLSIAGFAQGGVGTITGTVTDPKGLTVAQAKVVIRNIETGIARPPLDTSDSGNYSATFLQPGHYEVSIDKDGFSPVVRKDLVLQVGQTLTVDVALTVGTSVAEITVTGDANHRAGPHGIITDGQRRTRGRPAAQRTALAIVCLPHARNRE
jgi:hypothetical protein